MNTAEKAFLLFDLDGTLTNPKTGITKSVQYALRSFGVAVDNLDDLTGFIGPPLRDSFQKYFSFSKADAETAVQKYREYFAEQGIYENVMYDGVPAMLETERAAGKKLIIATSKATVFAERILAHFAIDGYFSLVAGSEWDGRRARKAEVIRYALETSGVSDLHKAVMIGDTPYDIAGAKEVGIESVGVLYGFGSLAALTAAGADCVVESVDELARLF